jgi:Ran GTPase-activating protein (RanGAP) involved in mRNA processing and transport
VNNRTGKAHQRSKTLFAKLSLSTLPIDLKAPSPPEFENIPVHDLPTTGPVANFFRDRTLPSSPEDLSQVMRFCIRERDGSKAARLVKEFLAQGGDSAPTLCLGYPPQGDEQGPLTDDDLKFLVSWINEWMPQLPGEAFTLDLSGNDLTPRGLQRLDKCLIENPKVQGLDLSRTRFLVQPWLCKKKPAEKKIRKLHRKLTSPRGEQEPPQVGEVVSKLLKSRHLQRLWLNGNPFSKEVRERIIGAAEECHVLRALGMSGCALSESDIRKLLSLNRSKHWSDLALGTKLTPGMVTAIAKLLSTTRDLRTLSLEISGSCSLIEVTELFSALGGNHSLEVLSLAGLRLAVDSAVVADALRRNTCLHTLNLSRSEISEKLVEALVKALARESSSEPNKTLTNLILPSYDHLTSEHQAEAEMNSRLCALAINRNRSAPPKGLVQLRAEALSVFTAGCSAANPAPVSTLSPELCKEIVQHISNDELSLRSLACVVRKPDPTPAVRAPPRTWQAVRSPRDLKSPP